MRGERCPQSTTQRYQNQTDKHREGQLSSSEDCAAELPGRDSPLLKKTWSKQAPAEFSVTARPGVLGTLQVIHSYQCGQVPSSPKDLSPALVTASIGLCCVNQGSFWVGQMLASLLGMS